MRHVRGKNIRNAVRDYLHCSIGRDVAVILLCFDSPTENREKPTYVP